MEILHAVHRNLRLIRETLHTLLEDHEVEGLQVERIDIVRELIGLHIATVDTQGARSLPIDRDGIEARRGADIRRHTGNVESDIGTTLGRLAGLVARIGGDNIGIESIQGAIVGEGQLLTRRDVGERVDEVLSLRTAANLDLGDGRQRLSVNGLGRGTEGEGSLAHSVVARNDGQVGHGIRRAEQRALGDETDIDPTNNALDIAMGFKRKVLLEEFTTESCPNCPRVAGYLHTALENPDYEGEVFAAAHHVMYYTDWLTTKRSVVNGEYIKTDLYDYASLYNDRGTYAPAMMFGRNAWFDAMSTAGNKCCTYMPGSAMEIESLIQQIQSDPANIIITNLSARYGDNDTTIVVRVEGMRNSSAKDGSRITVMLTEDNIAAHAQMGAEGSFTHQHVTRAINSIWGEPIEWDGNKFSYEVSLGLNTVYFTKNDKVQAGNFEEAWRMWNRDNLNIVAFVNYYSKNVEGCAVENVEGAKFNDAINGIEDLPQTKESQTVRSEVYTIDGKRIEADQMGRGLYIIRDIQADGSVHTRKVMRK